MEDRGKFWFLNFLGIIFIFLGMLAIWNTLRNGDPSQIFWLCYFGMIFIGVGIITRNGYLIMSQVCILAIPTLVWDADFIYHLITGMPLAGITDYFFTGTFTLGSFISLQHLFSVPLAIYTIYLIGIKRKDAWKISFLQITIFYLISYFFTSMDSNVNCAFEPCLKLPQFIPYTLAWFAAFFFMAYIANFFLNQIIFFRKSNT